MKNLSILIPLLLVTTISISQSTDKKVILINGEATEVVISNDGEVAELIEKKADFMVEFEQSDDNKIASLSMNNAFDIPTDIFNNDNTSTIKGLNRNQLNRPNVPANNLLDRQKEEE